MSISEVIREVVLVVDVDSGLKLFAHHGLHMEEIVVLAFELVVEVASRTFLHYIGVLSYNYRAP